MRLVADWELVKASIYGGHTQWRFASLFPHCFSFVLLMFYYEVRKVSK